MSADGAAPQRACPEGRLSSPVMDRDGTRVLDLETYVPHLLASVNNPLSSGASATYLKRFGLGVVEWRVLSTLMIEPGIPAARIGAVFAGDKGAVSRALKRLADCGAARFQAGQADPRRKTWWLTEKGRALHNQIIEVALERERRLIQGVAPEDLEAFLRVMRRMRKNVSALRPEGPGSAGE